MSNLLTVIVLGVYTIIYLVVFFIQKSQLNKVKEINTSMKAYMEIFKIDEVKRYVELKSESILLEAQKFIREDEKIRKLITESAVEATKNLSEGYNQEKGAEYLELYTLARNIIKTIPEANRIDFVSKALPKTGQELLEIVKEGEKGTLIDTNK